MLFIFACNNAQQNVNTSSKQNDNVLIPVIKNEKVGYIDLNGQWVIQPQFQDAQLFNNQGLARVKQNNLWGVIDQNRQNCVRTGTRKEVGEGENLHDEFGILKDGKHTVLKDVDEIGNLMYPYY